MSENKLDHANGQLDSRESLSSKLFEESYSYKSTSSPVVPETTKVSPSLPELTITGLLQSDDPAKKSDGTEPALRSGWGDIRTQPWPPRDRVILPVEGVIVKTVDETNPSNVANKLAGEKEIGKDAFEKIQDLLKNKGPEEAQKYIDEINKALENRDPNLKLELKDIKSPGRGPVGRDDGYPGSETTDLRLVDKSKDPAKAGIDETPTWRLKETKSNDFLVDKSEKEKPDFPSYEKYEAPSKRAERLANETAEQLTKRIIDTKDLDSITAKLENSGDIKGQVKRINEKLEASGSTLRLNVSRLEDPEGRPQIGGSRYTLDLIDGKMHLQSKTIMDDRSFRQRVIRVHESKKD